ncbi:GPW/gp25 family protein [bacterium]|nr:GPW/gp25 family protein [bacterium]
MSNYIKNTPAFTRKNARYSDISIAFGLNPFNEDVVRVVNIDAIKRSVKNLVLTDKYERLLDPDIGGNVRRTLFEPMTPLTEGVLQDYIIEVIENYEPRCLLESVDVQANYDTNSYSVTIRFRANASENVQTLDFLLERVR